MLSAAEVSVPAVLSVAEDEGAVQVCATLSLSTEVNITVTLATSNGTGMCVQQLAFSRVNSVYIIIIQLIMNLTTLK